METTILYIGAALVIGALAGLAAGRGTLSGTIKSLNDAVNTFRGDDYKYTPKQNAHWALGEYEEHKDELETIVEEKKAELNASDAKIDDNNSEDD